MGGEEPPGISFPGGVGFAPGRGSSGGSLPRGHNELVVEGGGGWSREGERS